MKKSLTLFILMSAIAMCFSACEQMQELEPTPQSKILEYKVTNIADTAIYGAIDEVEKTITVYVPFYYNLAVIDPALTLSDGAVLQEAIVPVSVGDSSVVYTVKGSDGTTTTYKLDVQLQFPGTLQLTERSSAGSIVEMNPNKANGWITGNFYTSDKSLVEVSLISEKTGGIFSMDKTNATIYQSTDETSQKTSYTISSLRIPILADSGLYKMQVKLYGQTATTQYPIRIKYIQPNFTTVSRQVKQGESFTFAALSGTILLNVKSVSVKLGDTYFPLIVDSYTRTEVHLRVPDDFPVMTSTRVTYRMEFDSGWASVEKSSNLEVLAK